MFRIPLAATCLPEPSSFALSAKICSLLEMSDERLGTDLWTHIGTISGPFTIRCELVPTHCSWLTHCWTVNPISKTSLDQCLNTGQSRISLLQYELLENGNIFDTTFIRGKVWKWGSVISWSHKIVSHRPQTTSSRPKSATSSSSSCEVSFLIWAFIWSFLTYSCSAGDILRNWACRSGLPLELPGVSWDWDPFRAMQRSEFGEIRIQPRLLLTADWMGLVCTTRAVSLRMGLVTSTASGNIGSSSTMNLIEIVFPWWRWLRKCRYNRNVNTYLRGLELE